MTNIVIVNEVADYVSELGISEVVHFTRNSGMLGIATHGAIIARKHLPNNARLKYIYEPNAKIRKDIKHFDYVNLSVDRVNASFFGVAANRWYSGQDDLYWCVLAFDPVIMTHQGVLFTTTNNMYSGVDRAPGLDGLKALYDSPITQWEGKLVYRTSDMQPSWPTCRQAEVLYKDEVPLKYLRTVYVAEHEHADEVIGWLKMFKRKDIQVFVRPEAFR